MDTGPNSLYVSRADLGLAMDQILYHSSPQLPFPFHLLLEYPKPLSVYYKLSQKGGIRNCSLLSILRDGETLQECCSRDQENTICGKAFVSEENSICKLVRILESSEQRKWALGRVQEGGFTEVFNRSFSNQSQEEPRDQGPLQSQGLYFLWEKKAELIGFQTRLGRNPYRSWASELYVGQISIVVGAHSINETSPELDIRHVWIKKTWLHHKKWRHADSDNIAGSLLMNPSEPQHRRLSKSQALLMCLPGCTDTAFPFHSPSTTLYACIRVRHIASLLPQITRVYVQVYIQCLTLCHNCAKCSHINFITQPSQ